jgi:hypothetical protein
VRAHEREKFFFCVVDPLGFVIFFYFFSIFPFFSPVFLVCLGNALPVPDGAWHGNITEIRVLEHSRKGRERGIASVASVML